VLPIGGVRDKVLAAQRAGLGRVILPRENEHDLEDLPPETRDALGFVLVDSIDEVFAAAFNGKGSARAKPVPVNEPAAAQAAGSVMQSALEPSSGVGRPAGQSPSGL
jgi:predicted ATP-dependent protease